MSLLRGSLFTRAVVVAAVAALSLSTAEPADAGKKKKRVERTEERAYVLATGVRGAADSPCAGEPVGCAVFPIEAGEKFVSLDIADASGMPLWASVYIYGYTDGSDSHEHVCGATETPLVLGPDLDELVVVTTQTTGGATNPCTGPATAGTVTATFSNLR